MSAGLGVRVRHRYVAPWSVLTIHRQRNCVFQKDIHRFVGIIGPDDPSAAVKMVRVLASRLLEEVEGIGFSFFVGDSLIIEDH